jgi:hypothetical protein
MASKDDLFAQFKVQTTALLSTAESKRVKDALSAFLESKVALPSFVPFPPHCTSRCFEYCPCCVVSSHQACACFF